MRRILTWIGFVVSVALGLMLGRELLWEFHYHRAGQLTEAPSGRLRLPPCPGCNLIILSMDTLRADFAADAPNLQTIAKRSVEFTNAYTNAFYTTPSHMTLFTSLYPNRHKVTGRGVHVPRWPRTSEDSEALSEKYFTLAEVLKRAGYKTHWYAPLNIKHLDRELGFGRGFDLFSPTLFTRPGRPGAPLNVKELTAALAERKPFFYFFHSYVTHLPYFLPGDGGQFPLLFKSQNLMNDYYKMSERAATLPTACASLALLDGCLRQPVAADSFLHDLGQFQLWAMESVFNGRNKTFNSSQRENLRRAYADSVHIFDSQIGELWRQLKISGHDQDTLVVMISDHGEELFEHGHGSHSSFYQHTARIPFLIYHPRLQEPVQTAEPVSLIDVMPTVTSMLKLEPPAQMQGRDLSSGTLPGPVFGYSLGNDYVTDGRWKLIHGPSGAEEFYYLPADPKERQNLASYRWPRIQNNLERLRTARRKWEMEQAL